MPVKDTHRSTIDHLFLNQVVPLVLSIQGKLSFHASAVQVGNGAAAFIGQTGRGKSTLAASFAKSGYHFLTDDSLVIEETKGVHYVTASHPSIRLWEDSVEALDLANLDTMTTPTYTSKARIIAGPEIPFCEDKVPLKGIYFLGDGSSDSLEILKMTGHEALIAWLQHAFLLDVNNKQLLSDHFNQLSNLVNQHTHYRLDYPRDYIALPVIQAAILQHLDEINQAA